ncbi:MAG: PorV/PorQ family protein [Bacteroidetes bacterium]|nr:PorV/PorQ family protein [Bacteroidota bacterium]
MKQMIISRIVIFFFLISISQAQEYPTAYFLRFTDNAQNFGIGDIGSVATDRNISSGLSYNPALLTKNEPQAAVLASGMPYLRQLVPNRFFANTGILYAPDSINSFGYNYTYFYQSKIAFSPSLPPIRIYDMSQKLRYSRRVSEKFSLGAGLVHLNRRLPDLSGRENNFAVDLGANYLNFYTLSENTLFRLNMGAALMNLGPKASHDLYWNPPHFVPGFLPATLQTGIMAGIIKESETRKFTIDVAYQIQKLLYPTQVTTEMSAFRGIIHSFSSQPGGFSADELIHQFGLEASYQKGRTIITSRTGLFLEKYRYVDQRYFSLGLGAEHKGFLLDFAYMAPLTQRHPMANTVIISLGKRILI